MASDMEESCSQNQTAVGDDGDAQISLKRMEQLYLWERAICELMQKIRQPRDLSQTLQILVNELGVLLGVDRGVVIEFDADRPQPLAIEYRLHSGIASFLGQIPPWDTCPYLLQAAKKELVFRYDTQTDEIDALWLQTFSNASIHGFVACPVVYLENILAVIVLHTETPRVWTEGDIALLKLAADQVAMNVYQDRANEDRLHLEEARERYQRIIDGSRDGIYEWDLVHGNSFLNGRFFELIGLPPDSPLPGYIGFMQRVHPGDRERVTEKLKRHFQDNEPYEIEFRLKHEQGGYRLFYSRGTSTRGQDGKPIRLSGMLTDITPLKQAERQLQLNEQKFQAIFNNAMDFIALQDDEGRYTDVNPALSTFLKLPPEQIVGKHPRELFKRDLFVDNPTAWADLIKTRQFLRSEFRLSHPDGSIRDMECNTVSNFLPGLHLSSGRDVTAQKSAERALRESEERYRLVMECANHGLWDLKLETGEVYWNDRCYTMLGLDREMFDVTLEAFQALIHPDDLKRVDCKVKDHFERNAVFEIRYRMRHASGGYRHVEVRGAALRDDMGKPVRFAGSITDVSERLETENAL